MKQGISTPQRYLRYTAIIIILCIFVPVTAQVDKPAVDKPTGFERMSEHVPERTLSELEIKIAMNVSDLNREKQRAAFLRAERNIKRMNNEELLDVIKQLGDYPLIPYLIEDKLRSSLSVNSTESVRQFLSQYDNTPLARSLRRKWLQFLAKADEQDLFIEFYRPTRNAQLRCHYLRYRYVRGADKSTIFEQIPALWNVGRSQDDACDPLFRVWMKAGGLSEALVLERLEKTADGGKQSLIPYLKSLLPSDKQYLADRWQEVRKNPANVRHIQRYPDKFPALEAQILSYGLSRLIWRDAELALQVYQQATRKIEFLDAQKARVIHRFAVAMAIDEHPQAETWLIKASELMPESETMRWHLAYLLKKEDWQSIALLIEKSPPQLTNENQFIYWLARAYEKLSRYDAANELYAQLASERHYYGFLSSARLNIEYSLGYVPVQTTLSTLTKIVELEATQRAYELRKLGRFLNARQEWNSAQRSLEGEEKIVAAVVSSAWGWHDQSIFTLSREGFLSDVERRFPLAYRELITREAQRNDIPPEWAFAIARRESSFMSDAVSSANAKGLMQILPSTARYLEKRRVSTRDLIDPNTNARLGTRYLRYLLNKLDNNPLLATASYNAGLAKVMQWLPDSDAVEADIWVETIPFKETRNYVKAVLTYQQIYEDKLNKQSLDNTVFANFVNTELLPN